jgi:hypothetical protein
MKTYKHIEDYIEVIAGVRDPVTNHVTLPFLTSSPISLARYDVNIVSSFAEQSYDRIAYTDKQAELAVKIVLKYERQLAKLGVDVAPANTPAFRIPIRQIDRTSRIWRDGDSILARFPYIESQVAAFKDAAKESQGPIKWDRDMKAWRLALTEYNVNWAFTFATENNYEIDPAVNELMNLIVACEQQPYKIELTVKGEQLKITNAAPELIDYIENKLGGFGIDNLYTLIDNADILGYTIDDDIESAAIAATSPRMFNLMKNKDSKIGSSDTERNFVDLIKYAAHTNRWPIYIYEPNLSNYLLGLAQKHFGPQLVVANGKELPDITEARAIHFTKYHSQWNTPIPLLLSSAGMLYGGEKQMLIDRAEKVVYFAHDVYNKSSRGANPVAS